MILLILMLLVDSGVVMHSVEEESAGVYTHKVKALYKGHTDLVTNLQADNEKVVSCSYDTTCMKSPVYSSLILNRSARGNVVQ